MKLQNIDAGGGDDFGNHRVIGIDRQRNTLEPPFRPRRELRRIGQAEVGKLFARVMGGLKTTFASHYAQEVDLPGALQLEAIQRYSQQATGDKFLVTPAGA